MMPSRHVRVVVDLARVRANCREIIDRIGMPLIAVVKADAYGLGAEHVAATIGDLVDGFYVFDAEEVIRYRLLPITGKRSIALHGASNDPKDYLAHRIHPAVWTADRAAALRPARPALSVDTGQQRFAAGSRDIADIIRAAEIEEVFTHASTLSQVERLCELMDDHGWAGGKGGFFMHAAGSSLLYEPRAWLRAVRPGFALYTGAVRVVTHLCEVHESKGPAGYTGFEWPHFGVILAGYSNGMRPGPCLVNGRPSRVLEVGMQSSFVQIDSDDRVGDEVVLLGDTLTERNVAAAWRVNPHEALVRLTATGVRSYRM